MPVTNGSLQGTMTDPLLELEAEIKRRGGELDMSSAKARERAQAAAEAYQRAQAAPAPEDVLGEFLQRLAGNTASVLGGEPSYRTNAEERIRSTRGEMYAARAHNLENLMGQAAALAEFAQKAGDLAAEQQHRDRLEKLHLQLERVHQSEEKLAQQERDQRLQQYQLAQIAAKAQAEAGTKAVQVKPQTPAQVASVNFHERAQDADSLATQLENAGVRASRLPEIVMGDRERQYQQAAEQFAEAHLRKESGAAVTETELANTLATFFGRPGDSPTVLKQKRKARQRILQGLQRSAGAQADTTEAEPIIEYSRDPATGTWRRN